MGRSGMTPLAIAVLALLDERPMHPYEMYQLLLARREDMLVKVRPGSLYHAVARLAEDAMVRAEGTERAGNRPERTTYRITEDGRDALRERIAEWLRAPAAEYPIFRLALAEAHSLPAEEVVALLDERVGHLGVTLAAVDAMLDWTRAKGMPRRYHLHLDYIRATTQAELAWIERFAAELGSGTVEWERFDPDTGERVHQPDAVTHEWPAEDVVPRLRLVPGA